MRKWVGEMRKLRKGEEKEKQKRKGKRRNKT